VLGADASTAHPLNRSWHRYLIWLGIIRMSDRTDSHLLDRGSRRLRLQAEQIEMFFESF
jgi:hypothetical protein